MERYDAKTYTHLITDCSPYRTTIIDMEAVQRFASSQIPEGVIRHRIIRTSCVDPNLPLTRSDIFVMHMTYRSLRETSDQLFERTLFLWSEKIGEQDGIPVYRFRSGPCSPRSERQAL